MYTVELTESAKSDYDKLDGSQKQLIVKGLKRISARGMSAGEPLRGPLKGCNKIKLRQQGLRIVFHEVDNRMEVVQVIAIGKRDKSQVYKDAMNRIIAKN